MYTPITALMQNNSNLELLQLIFSNQSIYGNENFDSFSDEIFVELCRFVDCTQNTISRFISLAYSNEALDSLIQLFISKSGKKFFRELMNLISGFLKYFPQSSLKNVKKKNFELKTIFFSTFFNPQNCMIV